MKDSHFNYMKKLLLVMGLVLILASATILIYHQRNQIQNRIDQEKSTVVFSEPQKTNNTAPPEKKDSIKQKLPDSALIKMPFLVQAPFANWDTTHEEACEEASLIMVNYYLNKTAINGQEQSEKEILDLIEYENKNGYGPSITLEQLVQIAKSYFGLKSSRIVKSVTKESIETEIANGKPVIIPAAGKILPNPNFRNGGPNYHMLVIKGYNSEYFITNDPGTKNGEGFKYKFDDLINAIHNWNQKNILDGEKAYLVFD